MDAEQHLEWRALRDEARTALRSGDWMLRLCVFPSFDAPESIGIGMPSGRLVRDRRLHLESVHELRLCRWSLAEDADKLRSPVERQRHPRMLHPTIVNRSVSVDPQLIELCLGPLSSIAIPVLPTANVVGLDGTSFELFAQSGYHGINCHWWSEHPEQWQPLMIWFADTKNKLASILDTSPETTIDNSQDDHVPARNKP
ncbi:MAG: hypothetical protein K2W85_09830 [Phycisphaerales bacterium]|nr:hypothetical protein [Phycisphaerales bacterium]